MDSWELCAQVIQQAHEGVGNIPGSTTALLALVRPGNLLEVANVGDSGFRLLRNGSVVYASEVSLAPLADVMASTRYAFAESLCVEMVKVHTSSPDWTRIIVIILWLLLY
jgi:hypothetical protein